MINPNPTMFVFISMFLLFNFHPSHGDDEQLELLSSFKSTIKDPLNSLSTWNPSVPFCEWHGITCHNSSHVTAIELSGKNLSGKIEASIFQLPHVEVIDLSNNQFRSQIPTNMFSSSSSLRFLNLSDNNFTGSIPRGSIPHLETLDLSNNMLSGKIPEEIGSFSGLKYIDIGGNVLEGEIPTSISNITSLEVLTMASNQLTGEIPREIGQMKSLRWIYLGYNNLSGEIPEELGFLPSLHHLDLVYNNLTGKIPSSLGNLHNLQYLFLYQNKLSGPIPKSIFGLKKLLSLDLSDNSLSGEIPELIIQLQNLEILHLFGNNFTGKIPAAVASLPKLQVLQLWSNKFSGKIPWNLGRQGNLTVLDLSTNFLTGKIPETLCDSGMLFKLILFSNSLEGEIPRSLGQCRSLGRVRLQNNKLSGGLPSGFTELPLVYYLDVSGNNLSGRIGDRKWEIPALQMLNLARNSFSGNLPESFGSEKLQNLDLSGNDFSGAIPPSYGRLSELMELYLNENKLSGEIPDDLSSCKKLVSLDLRRNQLSGEIPIALSDMPVLGSLDLSENQLSGEIPENLGKMQSLVEVNISYNYFHGSLPSTGAFADVDASAVAGNTLCGGDSVTGLPPCKMNKKPTTWFVLSCFLIALTVMVLAALVVVFMRRRKELDPVKVERKDGTWELQFFDLKAKKSIAIDDILAATKEENIISRKWRNYKGRSVANHMEFVVKEINDKNSISTRFWSEVAELGKIDHPNVVKMIGICRTENGAGYLIYEHVEGKDLNEVLQSLSWERRRKIAIGVAKALSYLHGKRVIIGEMSPENVILDGSDDEARLRIIPYELFRTESKSFAFSAYVAPETRETKEVTEKSDVFGFGLFLINLLTGKAPGDAELGVHKSIVEWARYCYSDCHLESWIDPVIRNTVMNDQNRIVEAMNLALQSTAGDPSARPPSRDVVKTLEVAMKAKSCVKVSSIF